MSASVIFVNENENEKWAKTKNNEFVNETSKTTRRMAIANGTCVSFCNQPKAHYLATSRESRRYVVAFSGIAAGSIWLHQFKRV